MNKRRKLKILIFLFFLFLLISAAKPYNYFTWFLEVVPALLGFAVLAAIYKKFEFSFFAYLLIFFHSVILMIGGHYTYGRVPLFNFVRDFFGFARNHYDRVGHFAQGFFPAIVIREILIRNNVVKNNNWLSFITISITLSVSVFYEFFEWWIAIFTGSAAGDFLGTQGDIWDTQWDMLWALIGATLAVILLGKLHDKSLAKIGGKK